MNGKQLKNSILQWAIQGKLVPQDPNDEPATVLLERIRAEKARLVKEGKIKKDKNETIIFRGDDNSHYEKLPNGEVRCIDEELPFEIPSSWCWFQLSDCVITQTGLAYCKNDLEIKSDNSIRVLRGGNILSGSWVKKNDDIMIAPQFVKKELILKQNTFITPAVTSLEHLGKTALISEDQKDIVAGGFVLMLKAIFTNESFLKYLNFFFQSSYYNSYCKNIANKSGQAFYNLSRHKLLRLYIPLPPLSEIFRINQLLYIVLPLIEIYDKNHVKLNNLNEGIYSQLKKSILQEAIQGRLVEQCETDEPASELLKRIQQEKQKLVKEGKLKAKDVVNSVIFKGDDNKYYEKCGNTLVCIDNEIPFDLPKTWQWIRGNAAFLPMQSTKPNGETFTYIDIDAVNNRLNIIDKAKNLPTKQAPSRATRKLHKNDVLFSMVRPYLRNIALVSEIKENVIASTGFYVISPTCAFNPRFLLYLMISPYVVDGLNEFMKGDNSPSINNYDIEHYLYPLPPLAEQQRIVAKLEQALASIMSR